MAEEYLSSMLLIIDNYDSFTFNLSHYLQRLGAEVMIHRHDAVTVEEIWELAPQAIVLSPGPCTPQQAGICLELVAAVCGRGIPLLGVCLGHQVIAEAFGGRIMRAHAPVHGKMSTITHDGRGLFRSVPSPFRAVRYHSLMVDPASLPRALEVTAWSEDGVIMGVQHREQPLYGVQFHPESVASQHGHALLSNFLKDMRG